MGLFSLIRSMFSANAEEYSDEQNPQRVLNTYIESNSEKLREFSILLNRMESERLSMQERIRILEKEFNYLQLDAEQALIKDNESLARSLLEKKQAIHLQLRQNKEILLETDKTVLRLREDYQSMNKELNEAKAKRDDLIQRGKNAHVAVNVNRGMDHHLELESNRAIERLKDEIIQAEAEAEVRRSSRDNSLDEEFELLFRNKPNS